MFRCRRPAERKKREQCRREISGRILSFAAVKCSNKSKHAKIVMPLSEAPSGEEPGTVRNQAAVAVSRAFENAGWTKSKLNKLCRGERAAKLRELSCSTPRWKSFHETV